MNTPIRVAGFLLGVAALFGGSFAVGNLVGPVAAEPESHGEGGHGDGGHEPAQASSVEQPPGGLMTSQDGYRVVLTRTQQQPGRERSIAFRIEGPGGLPVTSYDVEHDKQLHFIAVRRDFRDFQHDGVVRTAQFALEAGRS